MSEDDTGEGPPRKLYVSSHRTQRTGVAALLGLLFLAACVGSCCGLGAAALWFISRG